RHLPAYWTENANGLPRWLAEWRAFLRIALGLVLVAVAMAFVCLPGTTGYEAAASDGPGAAWGNVVRVYLCWYVGFSGWTEARIGLGRGAGVIALTVAFSCVGHATALFPPGMPLTGLWAIYRPLVPL